MSLLKRFAFLLFFFGILACEDQIFPELQNAEPIIVIDAWVTNKNEPQVIKISRSQSYFDNSLPPGVPNATVLVTDNEGNSFEFLPGTKTGEYIWNPTGQGRVFGKIGNTYRLYINTGGMEFEATAAMNRVPQLDSVTYYFEEGNSFGFPDSYFSEFWARDFQGSGDTYWARAWKNGQALNRPNEIVTAYDAGFSRGGNVDGIIFIAPIRRGFNPVEQDSNDNFLPVFVPGDSLYVELQSITNAAFDFLTQISIQTNRPGGFGELFAQPLANVPTNIRPTAANPNAKVLGFFNVAAVSGNGKRLVID
jgi:hypothetical protein